MCSLVYNKDDLELLFSLAYPISNMSIRPFVVGWKEPIDLPIARCDTTILFKSCDVVVAGQTTTTWSRKFKPMFVRLI